MYLWDDQEVCSHVEYSSHQLTLVWKNKIVKVSLLVCKGVHFYFFEWELNVELHICPCVIKRECYSDQKLRQLCYLEVNMLGTLYSFVNIFSLMFTSQSQIIVMIFGWGETTINVWEVIFIPPPFNTTATCNPNHSLTIQCQCALLTSKMKIKDSDRRGLKFTFSTKTWNFSSLKNYNIHETHLRWPIRVKTSLHWLICKLPNVSCNLYTTKDVMVVVVVARSSSYCSPPCLPKNQKKFKRNKTTWQRTPPPHTN